MAVEEKADSGTRTEPLAPSSPVPPSIAPSFAPAQKPAKQGKSAPNADASRPVLQDQLEALLFSSGKAMGEEQLCAITGAEKRAVRAALAALQQDYAGRATALKIYDEGGSWKLLVRDEHIPLVRRIVADTELSRAVMETLAIIAYHHPKALQSKVVDLRGGNAYDHIAELERLGFVVKSKEGRSFSLRLTEKFFDYFDVEGEKGIRQVFKEIKQPPKEQQQSLGDLEIVKIPQHHHAKGGALGDLEVVDELPPAPERLAGPVEPEPLPTAKLERDHEAEGSFLSKIEAQIEALSRRNDELAQDPLFKVPESAPGEAFSVAAPEVSTVQEAAALAPVPESPVPAPGSSPVVEKKTSRRKSPS